MNTPFDTTQPSQVKGLNGYTIDPIFTVGEKIDGYAPPGILDGIGAYSLNDTTVRLVVNHEIGATDGYKYTLKNGTQLPGARLSYFDVDKRTLEIVDSGLAYDTIINRKGEVVDAAADLEFGGIQRFCSAALFEANQFGAGIGLADRIFFAGEETSGGTQFALDTKTNTLYALPWFGRAAWENVTELNTGRTDKVAFLIGDDRGPAPLILYIGDKNAKNDGSFLDRNGLGKGKLFVWVADDPKNANDPIEADPRNFNGTNNSTVGKFVEINYYRPDLANTAVDGPDSDTSIQNELGYDVQGFATQAQQDKLAADVKAFLFSRPEDLSTNPQDGTQVVLASTGRETIFGGVDTYGTTYKIDIDFNNINTGDISAKIDILFDGNVTKDASLRNPDNLDWAKDGKIYIQEDRAATAAIFAGTSKEEASIWRIDPAVANPSSTLTRIAQVDRTALPATQTDSSPTDIGNWETSGILDVSTLFGNAPGTQFIFDVQAHSLLNGTIITATNIDGNNDGTKTRQENLVEGGQLSFLIAPNASLIQESNLVISTSDSLVASVDFDGVNDTVFTGSSNDTVDVALGGKLAGNNRINTGSGDDTIYAGDGDRIFAGSDDDKLDATDAIGCRLSGGKGNDRFYLGTDGRALGGDGDDVFYVQEGGNNLISGGAGKDQFWIVTGDLPTSANTIVDFQKGFDVLGIGGQGRDFGFDDLTLSGNTIMIGSKTIAMLTGVNTTTLTADNFTFA